MNKLLESWLFKEILDDHKEGSYTLNLTWFAQVNVTVVRKGHDRMAIIRSDQTHEMLIVFEGSDIKDIKDWVGQYGNFNADFNAEGLHDGWAKTYDKKFAKTIDTFVTNYRHYDWHCIGHSRGGALAGVCCYRLADSYALSNSGITYGSPRFTNKKARDIFNKMPIDFTRVIYDGDPVTRVNYRTFGSRHVGKAVVIGKMKFRFLFPVMRRLIGFKRHLSYGKKLRKLYA